VSTVRFIREAIAAKKSTGAIMPSSRFLADVMTEAAGVSEADVIVEYGPGTGIFTESILQKKQTHAHFIAMEINPEFVLATRDRCPEATVIHDCAQNALQYLQEEGHSHCDTIVSGLPWAVFDEALQDELLDATLKVLRPGGRFVTFAYFISPFLNKGHRFLKQKLPAHFSKVKRTPHIWRNIPPCAVYVAHKA
jgi:phospholipid N-methyltransferase